MVRDEADNKRPHGAKIKKTWCRVSTPTYEGWNFNSGNYLFTTDTK